MTDPDQNHYRLNDNLDELSAQAARSLKKAQADWMESQMARIMPKDIFELAKSESSRDRMKLAKWLARNQVQVREAEKAQDGAWVSALFKGNDCVSIFSIRYKDGKWETMAKDEPIP